MAGVLNHDPTSIDEVVAAEMTGHILKAIYRETPYHNIIPLFKLITTIELRNHHTLFRFF